MTDTPSQPATTETPTPAATANSLQPVIIVIFGVTGDLSRRYLLPSLYRLFELGLVHDQTEIVGVSRRDIGFDEAFGSLTSAGEDSKLDGNLAVVDADVCRKPLDV